MTKETEKENNELMKITCSIKDRNIQRKGQQNRLIISTTMFIIVCLRTYYLNKNNINDLYDLKRLMLIPFFQGIFVSFMQVPTQTCVYHAINGSIELKDGKTLKKITDEDAKYAMKLRGLGVLLSGLTVGTIIGLIAWVSSNIRIQDMSSISSLSISIEGL